MFVVTEDEKIVTENRSKEELKNLLSQGEEITLTGHEAWSLFLLLKELEELKQKEKRLRDICRKVTNIEEDIKRIYINP